MAREALVARGAVGTRSRSFSFPTDADTEVANVELVGICLSHSQQVVALLVDHDPASPRVPRSVNTGSSELAAELGRAAGDDGLVGLADVLAAAASTLTTGKGPRRHVLRARVHVPESQRGPILHLVACGEPVVTDGRSTLVGVQLDVAASVRECAALVGRLLRALCLGDVPTAARIASGVSSFLHQAGPSTEPFRWSRGHVAAGDTDGGAQLASGTVEVIARAMGDDGEWVSFTSRASSNVTQSGFGAAPRSYVESAGAVEQAVHAAGREAQRGATEAYPAYVARKSR